MIRSGIDVVKQGLNTTIRNLLINVYSKFWKEKQVINFLHTGNETQGSGSISVDLLCLVRSLKGKVLDM